LKEVDFLLFVFMYMLSMSLLGYVSMWIDKRRAQAHLTRVPERVLLRLSFFGGAMGTLMGMYAFRHKNRKRLFVIGLPLCLVLNIMVGIGMVMILL